MKRRTNTAGAGRPGVVDPVRYQRTVTEPFVPLLDAILKDVNLYSQNGRVVDVPLTDEERKLITNYLKRWR